MCERFQSVFHLAVILWFRRRRAKADDGAVHGAVKSR